MIPIFFFSDPWLIAGFAILWMILGISLIVLDMLVFGCILLGGIGVVIFMLGVAFFFQKFGLADPVFEYILIILFVIVLLFYLSVCLYLALRAWRRPIVSGREGILGAHGRVIEANHQSWVRIHGERWRCESQCPLFQGEDVIIQNLDGLICIVKPVQQAGRET